MKFAPDAYAEGISNVAAGSEIEVLVDTIDTLIDAISDAIEYRVGTDTTFEDDPEDPDGIDDKDTADAYQAAGERLLELRRKLVEHPENEDLSFGAAPIIH